MMGVVGFTNDYHWNDSTNSPIKWQNKIKRCLIVSVLIVPLNDSRKIKGECGNSTH
jgi:hypothetical protein